MTIESKVSNNNDTLFLVIPPDRFYKFCHDTTVEGKTLTGYKQQEIGPFFTQQQPTWGKIQPTWGKKYQPDWIFALLLLGFVLIAWVQFFYRKRLQQVILSPFSKRFMNQLMRDGNLFKERISVAMGAIYFISLALLIFESNELILKGHVSPFLNGISFYLLIIIVLILYWSVKVVLISVVGLVFKTAATTKMYLLNVLVINIITGLLLLPLLVFIIYLKSIVFLYISITFFLLTFIFLLIRGFITGLTLTKFSYIFLFVYLCTLEILPLIIFIKFSLIFYNSMMM